MKYIMHTPRIFQGHGIFSLLHKNNLILTKDEGWCISLQSTSVTMIHKVCETLLRQPADQGDKSKEG